MSLRVTLEPADLDPERRPVEVVECKGIGHPDTLCDAAAEAFSQRLARAYVEATGRVLHHNVDKALLVAGRTESSFGGGRWLDPIEIILAGRATAAAGGVSFPLTEIGRESVGDALSAVRHLDVSDPRQVQIRVAVRPGEAELQQVFDKAARGPACSGDTSIGVGFAPYSRAEQLARTIDARLRRFAAEEPDSPVGEDTKVMVTRDGGAVQLTIAAAMVARHLIDASAYGRATEGLRAMAIEEAHAAGFERAEAFVNAADEPSGSFYLTISGTSAECGDDGQVGRGNRLSGLITPMRPMTLEAYAGKNPATHVGKLLSVAASRAAERCAALDGVRAAECVLVSRIGAPVSEPQLAGLRLDAEADRVAGLQDTIEEIVLDSCTQMPDLWRELIGL